TRRFRIQSIPKRSSGANTRCCAVAHGPRDPERFETRSGIGIIPCAGRSSAGSAARAMTSSPILSGAMDRDEASRRRRAILAEVREGLSRAPRELSPKYFYDERGSQLFEEITRL